jgi:hypothetical protein
MQESRIGNHTVAGRNNRKYRKNPLSVPRDQYLFRAGHIAQLKVRNNPPARHRPACKLQAELMTHRAVGSIAPNQPSALKEVSDELV